MKIQITIDLNKMFVKPYVDAWERYFAGEIREQEALKELEITQQDFDAALAYMVKKAKLDDIERSLKVVG